MQNSKQTEGGSENEGCTIHSAAQCLIVTDCLRQMEKRKEYSGILKEIDYRN
jgi:hypothetical protein